MQQLLTDKEKKCFMKNKFLERFASSSTFSFSSGLIWQELLLGKVNAYKAGRLTLGLAAQKPPQHQ